jgi:hypothetical protein
MPETTTVRHDDFGESDGKWWMSLELVRATLGMSGHRHVPDASWKSGRCR